MIFQRIFQVRKNNENNKFTKDITKTHQQEDKWTHSSEIKKIPWYITCNYFNFQHLFEITIVEFAIALINSVLFIE